MIKNALSFAAAALAFVMLAGCGNIAEKKADPSAYNDPYKDGSLERVLDSGKLVIGLDESFRPMNFRDANGNMTGFDFEVAREVCRRLGITPEPKAVNWETLSSELSSEKADCVWSGLSVTPERAAVMNFSEAYMENEIVFVVREDSGIASQSDLEGKIIAVQSGSAAQKALNELELDCTENLLLTNAECLSHLELDLVDAVLMDSVAARYEINVSGREHTILPGSVKSEEYAIAFRKGDNSLKSVVQDVLHEMKNDGTLGKISKRWFGEDITTIK